MGYVLRRKYYSDALRGKSLEQLQKEREERAAAAAAAAPPKLVTPETSQKRDEKGNMVGGQDQSGTTWRPPIREVL